VIQTRLQNLNFQAEVGAEADTAASCSWGEQLQALKIRTTNLKYLKFPDLPEICLNPMEHILQKYSIYNWRLRDDLNNQ